MTSLRRYSLLLALLPSLALIPQLGIAGAASQHTTPSPIGAARQQLFGENPWIIEQLGVGGGFGNRFSRAIANRMYSRDDAAAIADARKLLEIQSFGPRTWVLQFPIVSVAVFETDEGLVLVDSGYAPAGPALKEALAGLSNKPVHTVILTHHHVDHALGAWALLDSENRPDIIASDEFLVQQQNDIYLSAFRTRRNHQSPADAPRSWDDVVRPTRTFSGSLELSIGGETFALNAARGETADQLYVFVPGRKTLVTADYYQRFIPNAGNGRRPQRYPAEWSRALHDMAALDAELMIPMHGPVLTDPDEIRDRLTAHAELLASLDRQVADALNRGQPEHTIAQSVTLPEKFVGRDDVAEMYVSVGDIARMILHEYTGWWDDVPSHWNPAPLSAEAVELARLAGGADKLAERARELAPGDIRLACQLADWAWLAEPRNPAVLKTSYELYLERLRGPVPTQEALAYVDHLVALRLMINMLNGDAK